MIHFNCPSCRKAIRVGDASAGKAGTCPGCGATVHVPELPAGDTSAPPPLKRDQRTAGLPGDTPTERPPAEVPQDLDASAPETHAETPFDFDGASVGSPRGRLVLRVLQDPLVPSVAALVIAIATAAWCGLRDPLGAGISAYDFTTPATALDSRLAIDLNGDIRAIIDLGRLVNRHSKEKRETVKIHRDAEYGGKKILFISFKENGLTKYDTEAFEK